MVKALTRNVLLIAVILALLPSNVRCEPTNDFKIGAVLAMTGAAELYGRHAQMSMELAAEEINAQGGIAGKKLKLIFEDSATQALKATGAFHKLTEVDHVDAVVGEVWAFLTIPLIPLA